MTKDVLVSISGLQYDIEGDEAIELISTGTYYLKNQKHYVQYEEMLEGDQAATQTVKCMLKITEKQIELTKKGPAAVHMVFELGENHMTYYSTPYGDLLLGITTKSIALSEEEDMLRVDLVYGLDMNYQYVADCNLTIQVKSNNRG